MPYTGTPPTFTAGVAAGNAARLNELRDFARGFTDAWTAWTPTVTGWTLGNGTVGAKYLQVGSLVIYRAAVTVGTTTVIGAQLNLSLPVAAADSPLIHAASNAVLEDVGAAWYQAMSLLDPASGIVMIRRLGTNGLSDTLSSTLPFTWASGDHVVMQATYQRA